MYEINELSENWSELLADKIGLRLDKKNIYKIADSVKNLLSTERSKKIIDVRDKTIANIGKSDDFIIKYIIKAMNSK